jgi:hypothetical protein
LGAGVADAAATWGTVYARIKESDPVFRDFPVEAFQRELLALRLEVTSLAWAHRITKSALTIAAEAFTREYLDARAKLDVWDAMDRYNTAVARSASDVANLARSERLRRANITFMNVFRFEVFKEKVHEGADPKCVARVLNRTLTELSWRKGVAAAYLVSALSDACQREMNNRATLCTMEAIGFFYDCASKAARSVRIVSD